MLSEQAGFIQRMMFLKSNDGLAPIYMQRLGRIVAIAGANGAGKSRLLRRIARIFENYPASLQLTRDFLGRVAGHVLGDKSLLDLAKGEPNGTEYVWPTPFADPRQPILMRIESATRHFDPLANASLGIFANYQNPSMTLEASTDTLWCIAAACQSFVGATSEAVEPPIEKNRIISRFEDLRRRIKTTLGTDLHVTGPTSFSLFGLPSDDVNLSDGQRRLLDIAVKSWNFQYAVEKQGASEKRPLIIVMDEPENHLHPDALIEMLDAILRLDSEIQVFLATHSLPLLAHIGTESTWFMEDGSLVHGGRQIGRIVESLLGGERNVANLRTYLAEPANFSLRRFVTQCLLPPVTVSARGGDKQAQQLDAAITRERPWGSKMRVLDWGAGQGRMLEELAWRYEQEARGPISKSVDYYAYDVEASDSEKCKATIRVHYSDDKGRYIETSGELVGLAESVDVVMMCNVLHEIPPAAWHDTFKAVGAALKNDGRLFIAEDLLLPDGEQAFDIGFALLPFPAVQALFGISARLHEHPEDRYHDRLVVYEVNKAEVESVDHAAIVSCLRELKTISLKVVEELKREHNHDWQAGQRYAIASQSFITAHLALAQAREADSGTPIG